MKAGEAIAQEFLRSHPVAAARVLEGVTLEDRAVFLESLGRRSAVAVLQNMESSNAAVCLARWSDGFVSDVLTSLPLSQSARMLRLVESTDRRRMLELVPAETARGLNTLLHYPEGTAASRMNPQCLAYPQDIRVGETWKRLRRPGRRSGYYVYVVDIEGILVGVVGLGELLSADPRRPLSDVMSAPVESILADTSGEAILEHAGWRRFPGLPVVDESGVLLGSIRYSVFRELAVEGRDERHGAVWNVALALGQLYWSSSSELLRGLAEILLSPPSETTKEEETDER